MGKAGGAKPTLMLMPICACAAMGAGREGDAKADQ